VTSAEPKKPKNKEWVRPFWFLFNVGWYMAFSILIPVGIGYWIDQPKRFDSKPLFTLIGLGLGTVLAFYGLYRMLRQFQAEQEAEQKKQNNNRKELKV